MIAPAITRLVRDTTGAEADDANLVADSAANTPVIAAPHAAHDAADAVHAAPQAAQHALMPRRFQT